MARLTLILQKNYEYNEETRHLTLHFKDYIEDYCGNNISYIYEEYLPETNKRRQKTIGEIYLECIKENKIPAAYNIVADLDGNILKNMRSDGIIEKRDLPTIAGCIKDIDKIRELSQHKNKKVREKIAVNKNTPEDVIIRLINDSDENVRAEALGRDFITEDVLRKNHMNPYWYIRYRIIHNINCPQDIINVHAGDQEWTVREAVANKTKDEAILLKLAQDESSQVIRAILRNQNVDENIISEIYRHANKKDKPLLTAILQHNRTPDDIIQDILRNNKKLKK